MDYQRFKHLRFNQLPIQAIDQHIQRIQPLNVVPPHTRDAEHITRLQISDLPCGHRLMEARESLKVRLGKIDKTDLLPGRVKVEWTWIQVFNLLRREDGEMTLAYHTASEIIRGIVMGVDLTINLK